MNGIWRWYVHRKYPGDYELGTSTTQFPREFHHLNIGTVCPSGRHDRYGLDDMAWGNDDNVLNLRIDPLHTIGHMRKTYHNCVGREQFWWPLMEALGTYCSGKKQRKSLHSFPIREGSPTFVHIRTTLKEEFQDCFQKGAVHDVARDARVGSPTSQWRGSWL